MSNIFTGQMPFLTCNKQLNELREVQSHTDHLLVMIAAVANVLDVVVFGTSRHFTQQTLALSTEHNQ